MLVDKPKYISNKEAYKRIASELGVNESDVETTINSFFGTLIIFITKQKQVALSGLGKFIRTKKGTLLMTRRAKKAQKVSDRRHSTHNRYNRKK